VPIAGQSGSLILGFIQNPRAVLLLAASRTSWSDWLLGVSVSLAASRVVPNKEFVELMFDKFLLVPFQLVFPNMGGLPASGNQGL
jgi:hypothetical protein